MQALRFIIKGQKIIKDPESPFRQMVAGTSNYYVAEFDMDAAWTGYTCLAHFTAGDVSQYVPIVYGKAQIPNDILKFKTFAVDVVGQKGNTRLTTGVNKVTQAGGIT